MFQFIRNPFIDRIVKQLEINFPAKNSFSFCYRRLAIWWWSFTGEDHTGDFTFFLFKNCFPLNDRGPAGDVRGAVHPPTPSVLILFLRS